MEDFFVFFDLLDVVVVGNNFIGVGVIQVLIEYGFIFFKVGVVVIGLLLFIILLLSVVIVVCLFVCYMGVMVVWMLFECIKGDCQFVCIVVFCNEV